MKKRKTLDTLPWDILHHILHVSEPRGSIARRYRICNVLARVNRALRRFALPHILNEIYVGKIFNTPKLLGFFKANPSEWTLFVRSICLGKGYRSKAPRFKSLTCGFPLKAFKNLSQFECLSSRFDQRLLNSFELGSHLRGLTISWHGIASCPDISGYLKLQTLRLYIDSRTPRSDPSGLPFFTPRQVHVTHHALTTLSIMSAVSWFDNMIHAAHFPSLRVLNLQETRSSMRSIFHFVQSHPTLEQVNVTSVEKPRLRLCHLMRLIEGTGVWKNASSVSDGLDDGNINLDNPYTVTVTSESNEAWKNVCLWGFAFSRRPVAPETPMRFCATSISLGTLCGDDDDGRESDLIKILNGEIPILDRIEYLCLVTSQESNFDTNAALMRHLSDRLQKWPKLRRFTLSAGVPWHYWGRVDRPPNFLEAHTEGHLEFFHEPTPPIDWETGALVTYGASELMLEYQEFPYAVITRKMELLKAELEELMRHPIDEAFLLINAWEVRNEPTVAAAVRLLAQFCPSLEEFNWYLGWPAWVTTLWKWKIHRKGDVVWTVSGELTWPGCTKGEPLPLRILVGQELEHHRASWGRRRV